MKTFAREMLWFLIAIVFAVPLAYFFIYLMNLVPENELMTEEEWVFQMEFFIIGAILGFIGVYIVRVIMWAITLQLK